MKAVHLRALALVSGLVVLALLLNDGLAQVANEAVNEPQGSNAPSTSQRSLAVRGWWKAKALWRERRERYDASRAALIPSGAGDAFTGTVKVDDVSDAVVSGYTKGSVRSCREVDQHGLCHFPLARQYCASSCDSSRAMSADLSAAATHTVVAAGGKDCEPCPACPSARVVRAQAWQDDATDRSVSLYTKGSLTSCADVRHQGLCHYELARTHCSKHCGAAQDWHQHHLRLGAEHHQHHVVSSAGKSCPACPTCPSLSPPPSPPSSSSSPPPSPGISPSPSPPSSSSSPSPAPKISPRPAPRPLAPKILPRSAPRPPAPKLSPPSAPGLPTPNLIPAPDVACGSFEYGAITTAQLKDENNFPNTVYDLRMMFAQKVNGDFAFFAQVAIQTKDPQVAAEAEEAAEKFDAHGAMMKVLTNAVSEDTLKKLTSDRWQDKTSAVLGLVTVATACIPVVGEFISIAMTLVTSIFGMLTGGGTGQTVPQPPNIAQIREAMRSELDRYRHESLQKCADFHKPRTQPHAPGPPRTWLLRTAQRSRPFASPVKSPQPLSSAPSPPCPGTRFLPSCSACKLGSLSTRASTSRTHRASAKNKSKHSSQISSRTSLKASAARPPRHRGRPCARWSST